MRAATVVQQSCNSCASHAGLVLSFIACFILLVIAPLLTYLAYWVIRPCVMYRPWNASNAGPCHLGKTQQLGSVTSVANNNRCTWKGVHWGEWERLLGCHQKDYESRRGTYLATRDTAAAAAGGNVVVFSIIIDNSSLTT